MSFINIHFQFITGKILNAILPSNFTKADFCELVRDQIGSTNHFRCIIAGITFRAHEAQFDQHKSLITDNGKIYVLQIVRGGCFLPDTLVMLADKSQVPVYSIQPGDNVLSFTGTGEIATTAVQEVFYRTVNNFIELHVYENTTILVTPDHLIFTGNDSFTPLRKLSVDDTVFALSEMGNSLKTVPIKSF
ncbi:unnamed protein product [Rotaria magnacalcarata]|uniref:Hint domain-containing protein n=3 Tax=Rotaria magnacalcarata TaxID=392030 RepID=A0A816RX53_9BILA|nr:unnamed protein product [Rotaria magnacalcarata]